MGTPCPCAGSAHSQPQATAHLLAVSVDRPFVETSYKWNHPLRSLLFLAPVTQDNVQDSSMVLGVSVYSFLLLSSIPLYRYVTCCLSIHQLRDMQTGFLHVSSKGCWSYFFEGSLCFSLPEILICSRSGILWNTGCRVPVEIQPFQQSQRVCYDPMQGHTSLEVNSNAKVERNHFFAST